MNSNHPQHQPSIFFSKITKRAGITAFLAIVLLQTTTGCNPEKSSPYLKISPTISPSITPTTSPTNTPTVFHMTFPTTISTPSLTTSPTITPTTSNITQWYIELIYDKTATENPKSFLDLDAMEISASPQSDLQFRVGRGTTEYYWLDPINDARAKSMGAGNVDPSDCKDVLDSFDGAGIFAIFKGNHFCVISNKDRFFLLRDEGVARSADHAIIKIRLFIKMDG
jgi:hypothetical protein